MEKRGSKNFELNKRECPSKFSLNLNFAPFQSLINCMKRITLTEDSAAVFKLAVTLVMRNQYVFYHAVCNTYSYCIECSDYLLV
jgi:hypothetical protein